MAQLKIRGIDQSTGKFRWWDTGDTVVGAGGGSFSGTLDDITTGSTNIHLTTTLKSTYDAKVSTSDPRLSDARTPTTHNHTDKVDKATGYSLVADTEIAKIHSSGSDNQDLSGLEPKVTGKHLSTNDYTTAEQTKLTGIETGANNYTHPSTHSADIVVDGTTNKAYTATEQTKLAGVEVGANNYTHPANHAPTVITQDVSNRFVSDTEKSTWNAKGSSNLALGDLSSNAYPGDKGKTGYDHSQAAHAPSGATVGADWNSNVANKPTLGTSSVKDIPATGDASATEVVYGTDTRLTNTRNAADVSAWAKAGTKPSYTAAEVGAEASGNIATHAALTTGVHGVGTGTVAKTSDIPVAASTVTAETSYGASSNAGAASTFSKGDHTHGTPATTKDTTAQTGMLKGNGSTIGVGTDGTDFFSSTRAIPGANVPNGIFTVNTAIQSQVVVAGTYYYITGSALTMPAASKTGGGMSTTTAFEWVFSQSKTAAGTAAYSICIYRGVNGSISDTRDVTQSLGTSTAVVDIVSFVVTLKVTTTGATGAYTWGITCLHKAATATGFGITDATPFFTGTVSSVAMNTASLKFGLGFMNTTGTPTILTAGCVGQVYNMN